jgi:branched-chain amino acid transport system ATP-binding protein
MLKVEGLQTSYGHSQVLFDITFAIERGEVVTLLGRNGMGKTTTVRSLMGMTPPHGGTITFCGEPIRGLTPFAIARRGLGLVPEGRAIFANLTVWENLTATARANGRARWTTERIVAMFPWIAERRSQMGAALSGGEQQMLAIARALMTDPELLILDEATEGLAPLIRREIWQLITTLKGAGQAILLIDKNLKAVSRLADRHYVIERGRVTWSGDSAALRREYERVQRFVGV